ncbi:hypothetical protein J1N35_032917 [Gossypium stocksii]|uniref:Amino acid permease/ SLC12A domain-containing protein n=1 Tax=Gossypium stocksii TaxID=47602 RepID=A0A9D3ZWQ8_9ROSI|nr:hypothetical protein J1N35_032917 [Gossypium stocksii]
MAASLYMASERGCFLVASGPYKKEPVAQAAGPLLALLGFLLFPFIWSVPEALIMAELSIAFPGNGGFVIWAECAFVLLGVISPSPFIIMSFIAIPKIQPHRWLSLGQKCVKRDWNLFFNTLFWNLNFWDNISTLAGEVDKPQKTFSRALLVAVVFTCLA